MLNVKLAPFQLVAAAVAMICFFAIAVVAIRQYIRTKSLPYELTHIDDRPIRNAPLPIVIGLDILLKTVLPESIVASIPSALIFSALDISLFVAFASICGLAISRSFENNWNRKLGVMQAYFIFFAALLGTFVVRDATTYHFAAWTWVIGGVAACYLIPLFTRLAYVEYYQHYMKRVQ